MRALLLPILRPQLAAMALATALVMAGSAVTLVIPWALGLIVGGLVDTSSALPPTLLAGTFLTIAVQSLLALASGLIGIRISADILAALRIATFDHVLRLPLAFHESRSRGDSIALLSRDVENLGHFCASFLTRITPNLVTLAGASVMMLRIDPVLAAPILLAIPVALIVLRLQSRRLRPLSKDLREQEAKVISDINESITMVPTIKRFSREAVDTERFRTDVRRARDMAMETYRAFSWLLPSVRILTGAAMILVLVLLQQRLTVLELTTAQWTSLLLYAGLIVRPLSDLAGAWGEVQMVRGSAARLKEAMGYSAEELGQGTGHSAAGSIVFDDVSFSYRDGRWALKGLDLQIGAGERIALVGPNGSGKSTALRLVCGLHAPNEGRVVVNGRATTEQALGVLRRSVSVVPQDVQLVDGTVRDNIAYGVPDASQEAVVQAAEAALADGFIRSFEDGYDTVVGENGVWLSGGQRQRIALARALLGDPGIVVLDEATAMFDIEGEQAFFASVAQVLEGRTLIVIAHTPTAFSAVDRIVELRDGCVYSDTPVRPE